MVIHSSPGGRKKKRVIPKEEPKKNVTPIVPEKNVAMKESVVEDKKLVTPVVDDPTAEEFIANLPKKQNRKKVTKIIEE